VGIVVTISRVEIAASVKRKTKTGTPAHTRAEGGPVSGGINPINRAVGRPHVDGVGVCCGTGQQSKRHQSK
jgi:hypothetical protein